MASSTLGLTLNRAPFPLVKEVLMEESTFVEISTKVLVGSQGNNIQWETCTVKIQKINHLNKKLMMNSIIEFKDTCAAGCLNLSNGEKIYSRFRELLGEVFRADWDNARQGKANSVAGFHKTLNEFISYHFSNTDLIDQKNMLAKAKKPFKYMVKVLCSHLRHLNKLMSKLPGANNTLPYDEGALKIELFKMMLSDWQINFNNTGLDIMDDTYTLQCLVQFHYSSRGNVQCHPGTQAERDYIASSLQSSPSGWRMYDIPTRQSWRPGLAGAHSGAWCRRWCRGQLPLPSKRTQLGDVFHQSTWANLLARFPSKRARGSSQGRMWKLRGRPGTAVSQSKCPFCGESCRGGRRTWIQRRTHVAK
jgi:hypothetical protein